MAAASGRVGKVVRLPVAAPRRPARQRASKPASKPGVLVGQLVDFTAANEPRVTFAGSGKEPVVAETTVTLRPADCGRKVTLLFDAGERRTPIIFGLVQQRVAVGARTVSPSAIDVTLDGERLVFTAQQEIVLQCGKASIVLTAAGRVIIKGSYLLQRSSGLNKIKGASVQIN
jgi:hypothetical protein